MRKKLKIFIAGLVGTAIIFLGMRVVEIISYIFVEFLK